MKLNLKTGLSFICSSDHVDSNLGVILLVNILSALCVVNQWLLLNFTLYCFVTVPRNFLPAVQTSRYRCGGSVWISHALWPRRNSRHFRSQEIARYTFLQGKKNSTEFVLCFNNLFRGRWYENAVWLLYCFNRRLLFKQTWSPSFLMVYLEGIISAWAVLTCLFFCDLNQVALHTKTTACN